MDLFLVKKGVKKKLTIKKLVIDNKKLTNSLDIADAMNNHFCKLGKKLASQIKRSEIRFQSYMNMSSNHTFFLKAVDESDVLEELLKLNHRKSAGPDSFSPKLIKTCAYALYKPLAIIINKSIASGDYPKDFKIAKVIPLYKEGKHCDPSNYRPISLLNCFDKIFEKLINVQLKVYLKKYDLLFEYQYSYREGFSCDLALLQINDYIKKEIDKGNFVVTFFIDLKKAFDTVDHLILCKKLEYYGIRGHCNSFFKSYLSNRKQYVHCSGIDSSIGDVLCGVPQGSVLGPTLFLLYINDMINCIRYSKLQLFADDTLTTLADTNLYTLFKLMKDDIKSMQNWFNANKLTLNLGKTCYSIFHSRRKMVPENFDTFTVNNITIERKKCAKYLGLTFDEVLSWRHHIDQLIASLGKYFSIFYQLRKIIPHKFKMQLFHAYVYPGG